MRPPFATKLQDLTRSRFMQFMLTAGMVASAIQPVAAQQNITTEQELPLFMKQPDNYEGALDTLKEFHPDVYKMIEIRYDHNNKKITRPFRTSVIYKQPMCYNDDVLFSDKNWETLYLALNDFKKDQDRKRLGFEITKVFEGYQAKSYGDTRNVKTIACGVQLTRPGKDISREKRVCNAIWGKYSAEKYRALYSGTITLNDDQIRKVTQAYIDLYDNRLKEILSESIRVTEFQSNDHPEELESNNVSIDKIDPVYFAFLSSMLYQSPSSFTGDVVSKNETDAIKIRNARISQEETQVISYPCLYALCNPSETKESQLQAFITLAELYATRLMRYYKDEPDKDPLRQLYSQRAALIISVVNDSAVSDMDLVAMQIRASHREQQAMTEMKNNPVIVLMGQSIGESFDALLNNPYCQWEPDGKVMVIDVARGLVAQQSGSQFIISSCSEEYCYYKLMEISPEAIDGNYPGALQEMKKKYFNGPHY